MENKMDVKSKTEKRKSTYCGLCLHHVVTLHFIQPHVCILQQFLNSLSMSLLKLKFFLFHFCYSIVKLHNEDKTLSLSWNMLF